MRHYIIVALLIVFTAHTASASGFPDYIKGAHIEADELDIQYQLVTTSDDRAKKDHKTKQKLEAYYGINDDWLVLGGIKYSRDYKHSTDLSAIYIGGAYQFLDAADYGFNAAVLSEYMHATDSGDPDLLESRLLVDFKWGADKKLKTKASLILERELGENRDGGVDLVSRVGTTYKISRLFMPGFEWHAGYGKINDIGDFNDEQEHYIGPVLYGEFETFENGGELEYQIGYYPGITDNSSDHAFKFLLEYELNF